MLGALSVLYCWTVWLILGQASDAYVGSILPVGGRQRWAEPLPAILLRQPQLRFINPSGYLRF